MFLSDDVTTQIGTFALVPQVVKAVQVPVIAAGGIADPAGVRAARALGAAGVQVGTAYLLCPESTTSALHRSALRSDAARQTALTNVFTGHPRGGSSTASSANRGRWPRGAGLPVGGLGNRTGALRCGGAGKRRLLTAVVGSTHRHH